MGPRPNLDGFFGVSNDGKLGVLLLEGSLVSSDDKVLDSDEGIKLGLFYVVVIGNILGDVYLIILGLYFGT